MTKTHNNQPRGRRRGGEETYGGGKGERTRAAGQGGEAVAGKQRGCQGRQANTMAGLAFVGALLSSTPTGMWVCLTAVCKALSLANAIGKGTDWIGNQILDD